MQSHLQTTWTQNTDKMSEKMKKQLRTLEVGTKFFFANNSELVCTITYNSGKTLRYVGSNGNTIRYGKMPQVCQGNLVTVVY